jgi:hypothetical protein
VPAGPGWGMAGRGEPGGGEFGWGEPGGGNREGGGEFGWGGAARWKSAGEDLPAPHTLGELGRKHGAIETK